MMGGKASSDDLGGNAAVHWIMQSSTAVLKYSVLVPRHDDISDGVAVSVDDA